MSASDRSSGTPTAPESSNDGGRLFDVGEMSPRSELLQTPATVNRKSERAMRSSAADGGNGRRSGGGQSSPPGLEQQVEALTSSSGGSHASQQAPPAGAEVPPMTVGSGRSSLVSLGSFDRDWFYSRTYLGYETWRENGMPPLTAAYVAGLIDGEGCIGILVSNRRTKPTYSARIDVGMTVKAKPLLLALQRQYGGRVRKLREATKTWGEAWQWGLWKRSEVRAMLEDIAPALILKAEQADLALRLIRMVEALPAKSNGDPKWTDQARMDAETIRAQVMDLNRKGPTVMEQAGWFARYVGGQLLTDQRSLLDPTGWEKFSGTWPASGSLRNGRVYERQMSGRLTGGSGSSYLHTPTTGDTAPTYDHRASPGYVRNKPVPNLAAQIEEELLPTPQTPHGGLEGPTKKKGRGSGGGDLPGTIRERLLPSPSGYEGTRGSGGDPEKRRASGHQVNLADIIEKGSLGDHTSPPSDDGNEP